MIPGQTGSEKIADPNRKCEPGARPSSRPSNTEAGCPASTSWRSGVRNQATQQIGPGKP